MLNDIKKFRLTQDTMNQFTESALIQCHEVLENLPETVYRVWDLFMVICDRNGFWLESLCKDVSHGKKNLFLKRLVCLLTLQLTFFC